MRRRVLLVPLAVLTVGALVLEAAPAHAAQVVARDDRVATVRDRSVVVDVLANDEGDELRVVAVGDPEHGTAELVDGEVSYTPDEGYVGADSFGYRVRDADRAEDRATVHVTVSEPVTVEAPGTWTVLRPVTIAGTGPAGAALSVRVTGPQTVRTTPVTVGQDGGWSTVFTPSWKGPHEAIVSVVEPVSGDVARATATARARYLWAVSGALGRAALGRSYRAGCPVAPSSLRALDVTYWDWNGQLRAGQVIAHVRAVRDLRYVFRVAFRTRFPFRSVVPVDHFYRGGRSPAQSDLRSMRADNTSAYNCRKVTGNRHRRSPHSYGISIDINPRENPYVTKRRVYPRGARAYLDRSDVRKGMLVRSSPVVKAFVRRGWHWGAHWGHPDYQHFDM